MKYQLERAENLELRLIALEIAQDFSGFHFIALNCAEDCVKILIIRINIDVTAYKKG